VGCCKVVSPRWFILVFIAVGLFGIGDLGDLKGAMGDFSESTGLVD
jgi:hypothetical protein